MNDDERHPVDYLAEEFAAMIRSGQEPEIEDYAARYPQHAAMIRAVFPSIALVERVSTDENHHKSAAADSGVQAMISQTPPLLGDFRIVREIGRGGMGVVYEAVQQSLKRRVALKVMSALIAGSEKQLRRFRREAESAASLHHSNIVQVYGIGEQNGLQYYAMQLIDGVTLADVVHYLREFRAEAFGGAQSTRIDTLLPEEFQTDPTLAGTSRFGAVDAIQLLLGNCLPRRSMPAVPNTSQESAEVPDLLAETCMIPALQEDGATSFLNTQTATPGANQPLPTGHPVLGLAYFQSVARMMANVAGAVQYAHQQGILHRDLKPANLILDRDGTVWVADFGLARKIDIEDLTQTGEIVGTLRYMAPEQLRGVAEPRTDIYALGVTLYELLTLRPAVDGPQIFSDSGRHAQFVSPRLLNPKIPADLETITLKACAAEPSGRYQSAADMEADLRRFLEDRPILARRVTPVERFWRWSRRNPGMAALSSTILLLLLLVAGLLAIGNHQKEQALQAIRTEYNRAEANLRDKTEAMAGVERERQRAETNLELAISAFEEVFNNIASRGRSDSLLEELNEDENYTTPADAVLSSADVTLLETLLGFFDRLAAENSKDLSTESAAARCRVGNIQQQLGRLDDADRSYEAALSAYRAVAARNPDDLSLVTAQAEILKQQILTAAKRGDAPRSMELYQSLKALLTSSDHVSESQEGRFVMATTINSIVSMSLRRTPEPRLRGRNPFAARFQPPVELTDEPPGNRWKRELTANHEALELLRELVTEDPENSAYQMALAQAFRDQSRIAQFRRDNNLADEAFQSAVDILESLTSDFPESDRFRFELAETLSSMAFRPGDLQRVLRAQQLCRELVDTHPETAEYRSLYATTLARVASIQFAQGRKDRAEQTLLQSVQNHQLLADQYPDVLLYQMALVRSLQQLAQIQMERNHPEEARRNFDAAIARLERLNGAGRMKPFLQPILTRLREGRSRLN